jgi:hypothetical protein
MMQEVKLAWSAKKTRRFRHGPDALPGFWEIRGKDLGEHAGAGLNNNTAESRAHEQKRPEMNNARTAHIPSQ